VHVTVENAGAWLERIQTAAAMLSTYRYRDIYGRDAERCADMIQRADFGSGAVPATVEIEFH
jgi:hypothetical protein